MGEIDYTKLDRFQIFCPHCGKLLKVREHIYESTFGLGSWDLDADYNSYQTCTCSECGIKANSREFSIDDIRAWKFPKGYKSTITNSQINYIAFLASHFLYNRTPLITSKQLASLWISQFVQKLNEENLEKLYEEKIKQIFSENKFSYTGFDLHNDKLLCFNHIEYFYKDYHAYVSVHLFLNKETCEITINLTSQRVQVEDVASYLRDLDPQIKALKDKIKSLDMPTEKEIQERTEQDRKDYKKLKGHYSCDYGYEDNPCDSPWAGAFGGDID